MKTKGKKKQASSQGLVPKLRFPEFRDAGEWETSSFKKIYSFKVTNSFSRDKLNYENGVVKNIHYGDIHTKFSTLFDIKKETVPYINSTESLEKIKPESYCIEGDMVFADASEDLEDVGKSIEFIDLNNEKLLAGLHTLLARQKKSKLIVGFGGYLFKSNCIRSGIKKEAQGAKVLGLSAGRLSNVNIYFPAEKDEQKRIVDCLSSLDELIAAQAHKLDILKAHKKGLMQQLFPALGQSTPTLRFPEFQDAGAWKKKILGKLLKINSGKGFKAAEYSNNGIRLLQIENVGYGKIKWSENTVYLPQNYIKDYQELVLREGDIVLALNRPITNGELKIAILTTKDDPSLLYQRVGKLEKISDLIVGSFVFYICQKFIKEFVIKQSIGSDQPFISLRELYKQKTFIPSPTEQQKIADCLSSLDELIAAQAHKIDTLKAHKKGMMQQLFPNPDEVDG